MKAYEEAQKIDRTINKLLESEPITKDNAMQWALFARTIASGLDAIHEIALEKVIKTMG